MYTRCPKPGIFFFAASIPATADTASAGSPISSSIRITLSLAPPCSGPLSVPTADVIAEWMSASVAAVTRAEKVLALSSWSAWSTSAISTARVLSASARLPHSMYRKFAAWPRAGSGATGGFPARRRPIAATIVATCATRRTDFRALAGSELSWASGS